MQGKEEEGVTGNRRKYFFKRSHAFVKQFGEMIREQYKITRVAQADMIHHKIYLWAFIERSLRIKKG